jgi:hypothetical protein
VANTVVGILDDFTFGADNIGEGAVGYDQLDESLRSDITTLVNDAVTDISHLVSTDLLNNILGEKIIEHYAITDKGIDNYIDKAPDFLVKREEEATQENKLYLFQDSKDKTVRLAAYKNKQLITLHNAMNGYKELSIGDYLPIGYYSIIIEATSSSSHLPPVCNFICDTSWVTTDVPTRINLPLIPTMVVNSEFNAPFTGIYPIVYVNPTAEDDMGGPMILSGVSYFSLAHVIYDDS